MESLGHRSLYFDGGRLIGYGLRQGLVIASLESLHSRLVRDAKVLLGFRELLQRLPDEIVSGHGSPVYRMPSPKIAELNAHMARLRLKRPVPWAGTIRFARYSRERRSIHGSRERRECLPQNIQRCGVP